MPIIFANNRFEITYATGDTKGNSFSNAYTFEDIYQYSLINNLGYISKTNYSYFFQKGIYFQGDSMYFKDAGIVINFFNMPIGAEIIRINYGHIRLGNNDSESICNCIITAEKSKSQQVYITSTDVEFNNCFFHYVRFRNIQGYFNAFKLSNSMINADDNTFDAGFSYSLIYLSRLTLFYASVNNNVTISALDNCTFAKGSRLYTQLPGISEIRKIKFIDDSYVYYVMNAYSYANTHDKYIIDSNSNITFIAQTNSSIAYPAYYNTYFQTTLKLSINQIADSIIIKDKNNEIIYQGNNLSDVTNILTYKSVKFYSPAFSTQIERTNEVWQPFSIEVSKAGYQSQIIGNIIVNEENDTTVFCDLKPNPQPIPFSIRRIISRIFNSGKDASTSELITEGTQELEATTIAGEAEISTNDRATFRPATNDILIEQETTPGTWEQVEIISQDSQIIRGSSSVIQDAPPVFIQQNIEADIASQTLVKANIISQTNIKAKIS